MLNTGGTFNKIYDPVKGELVVPQNDDAVGKILGLLQIDARVEGLIYKDSLEMDDADRAMLAQRVAESDQKAIVIVHGTDTMDRSAAAVAKVAGDRCVVFTGAMVPVSIEPREGAANLMLAISKALYCPTPGVYIAMQGLLGPYDGIYKDRQKGRFCRR